MFKFITKRTIYLSVLLIVTMFLLFFLDLFLGSVKIPVKSIYNILTLQHLEKESWEIIVINARLPKAMMAILCGATLSVCGLQMQTLFKNPLAGPYILGVSSGAGLGVAIFIMGLSIFNININSFPIFSNFGLITSAILGSFLILIILLLAIIRLKDIMTVLILGIMLGSIFTALIGIIQYFSNATALKSFIMWTMGDLSNVSLQQVQFLLPIILLGLFLSFLMGKKLNLYILGEEYATSLGLNIKQTRILIILITAILAGTITAFCGPIGFIGIIVPHMARMLLNTSDHRKLIPFSILLGINILLMADIIAQLPGYNKVLPINSITSLIGIPLIIWIIFKNKKIAAIND